MKSRKSLAGIRSRAANAVSDVCGHMWEASYKALGRSAGGDCSVAEDNGNRAEESGAVLGTSD